MSNCDRIVAEDLNVSGMGRLHTLARAITDAGLGDLRRLLEHKSPWYGVELVVADWWFPSSKTCSRCGEVNAPLLLSERVDRCEACGHTMGRDLNASVNLARWRARSSAGCGRLTHAQVGTGDLREEPTVTCTHCGGTGHWVGTGAGSSPRWGGRTATGHHRHTAGGVRCGRT